MKRLAEIEVIGTNAVKKLREKKLQNGLPFMINSKSLPSNQCYLEYPNGTIVIAQIFSSERDFTIVKKLNHNEVIILRNRYNLST